MSMNQKKNRNKDNYHSFQHKVVKGNSRRVKLSRPTDNIFISGPVQYEPSNQPISQANFIHATTTNHHHSSRSTRNAWANNKNTNNTNTTNVTTQNTQNPHPSTQQNIAPIPRRDVEFPALAENTTKNNKNNTKNATKKPTKPSIIEPESSWLQYDDDNAMDNMDDYDNNSNNNKPHPSLHTKNNNDSSQINKDVDNNTSTKTNTNTNTNSNTNTNANNNTKPNRFPSHYNSNRFNDDQNQNTNNNYDNQASATASNQGSRQHQNYSRPPYQRRAPNNIINVNVGSYERHVTKNNGYYQQQHAAVLDGFNSNKARHASKKRRYNKYNIKIRKTGRDDNGDIHWSASSKKRFLPNGSIQNFTPEFKPYRRPSYNAFLQAIKDRDKRDDEQLEQFQRDRKYFAKLHSNQHLSRLKQAKLAAEQEKLLAQHSKPALLSTDTQTQPLSHTHTQPQRGRNISRTRHLLQQQQLYASQMGLNASLLSNIHRPSPPGIAPHPVTTTATAAAMENNLNTLLRNMNISSSNTNTPPIIPFKAPTPTQILSLQQQTQLLHNSQISPNPVPQLSVNSNKDINNKKLSATTAPWTGNWKNMGLNVGVNAPGPGPGPCPDSGSTANNSRGTSPLDLSQMNNNAVAALNANKSNTVTPQSNHQVPPSAASLNATIPSINLTDVTTTIDFRRGSGGSGGGAVTKPTAKINLMNVTTSTNVPIRQFSQRIYQQNSRQAAQQLLQQQQQRQAMLNAQAQQAQMSSIWQQNKQHEQYINRQHNQWQQQQAVAQTQPQPQPQAPQQPQPQTPQQPSIYPEFHSAAYGHAQSQPGSQVQRHHNAQWNNNPYQAYSAQTQTQQQAQAQAQAQAPSSAHNQWQPTHNQQNNWQYGGQY